MNKKAEPISKPEFIFAPASAELLEHARKRYQEQKANFIMASKFISEESARLGWLLDAVINSKRARHGVFRSFFTCSHLESLHGTLKIMRHNACKQKASPEKKILIYALSRIEDFFDPLHQQNANSLVPGLTFINDFHKLEKILHKHHEQYLGLVIIYHDSLPLSHVDALFSFCHTFHLQTAFSEGQQIPWYPIGVPFQFKNGPDIYLFGENLTQGEIPFGAFSMRHATYKPWNSISNCLIHSSSFTGNTFAISYVLKLMQTNETLNVLGMNKPQKFKRFALYRKHINPKIGLLFKQASLAPEILSAKGTRFQAKVGRKIFEIRDSSGGSCCALRGHNAPGVDEVLASHSSTTAYHEILESKFADLTGLPYGFPSVSGSSAVDIAVSLALLASDRKTRIVTFSDNYSGKSLISLNLTRFSEYQRPFAPLYFDICEVNPFKEEGFQTLKKELESGRIALVWFEIIQGETFKGIPNRVLDLLSFYQAKKEIYIGVDEVLSGMFRSGSFLFSQQTACMPDLVTLGKGLSDMLFPIGYTLASERVYQNARATNAELVERLRTYYRNELGAHIALNGLNCFTEQIGVEHVLHMEKLFKQTIQKALKKSPFFQECRGQGLMLYLKLNEKAFPINVFGEFASEFLLSSLFFKELRILFLNSRFTPGLAITEGEVQEIGHRISQFMHHARPIRLFLHFLWRFISLHCALAWEKIRKIS